MSTLLDLPTGALTEGRFRWKIDQSLDDAFGNKYLRRIPAAVQQDLSGAGAASLHTYYTAWTPGGAVAGTLADGLVVGQLKLIRTLDANTGTLTFNGDATIVFTDTGDTALLVWDGSAWVPLELRNDADGATAPVYTEAS